jgi:hypothetical protein
MRPLAIFASPMWRGRPRPRTPYSKIARSGNSYLLVLSAVLGITSLAAAQRAAAPAHAAAPAQHAVRHLHSPGNNFAAARGGHPSAFRRSSPLVSPFGSLPFPFFGDSFNPDDIYSSGFPVASQPPPFLMEAMRQLTGSATTSMGQATSPVNNHQPAANDPLMIEFQNGQYVRVDSAAANGDALPLKLPPNPSSRTKSTAPPMISAAPPQPLPAALLIFRDGHSEEVRDYTIADGILYARGDYYTDGYWNKKIALAALDLPETVRHNEVRGVRFALPSASNEVITRP